MNEPPYKILLVEDDPALLKMLARAFNSRKQRVLAAATLAEAREKLKAAGADLVILDRGLPDGDGLELCAEIRRDPEHRSLPVLMLTAKAETGDKVAGLELGADDYLAKPFELDELKARIEALIRRT